MKKKRIIAIILIIMILLIPIPIRHKDGLIVYHAIVYNVKDYHFIETVSGNYTGIQVNVLGISVYDNKKFTD